VSKVEQQVSYLLELDKLKAIYRKALIKCDNNRYENSAEHSWHAAMAAIVLAEHLPQTVNLLTVVHMLLIHDIVEIDAGDTFAFGEQGDLDAQHQKEVDAANRIFGLLPEQQAETFIAVWQEFEQGETAEAQYAKTIDRLMPFIQNMQNEGGSWKQHGISKSQVIKRNQHTQFVSDSLWQYITAQIDLAVDNGWLLNE